MEPDTHPGTGLGLGRSLLQLWGIHQLWALCFPTTPGPHAGGLLLTGAPLPPLKATTSPMQSLPRAAVPWAAIHQGLSIAMIPCCDMASQVAPGRPGSV